MAERAKPKDKITIYMGELLNKDQADKSDSPYIVEISNNVFIDVKQVTGPRGRYINWGGPAGKQNNARMGRSRTYSVWKETGKPYISIFTTTKVIEPDEEIFVFMAYEKKYKMLTKKMEKQFALRRPTMQIRKHKECQSRESNM